MTTADKIFAGNIPAIYERFLVPMLFEPYAEDLAERLLRFGPKSLLEIAAGTGALTREIARRSGPDIRIVATDLNQPMLDQARQKLGEDGRISWQQADGMALPFEDGSFDAVLCQFGMMFMPDKVKAYREARRVLKPGGHFVFNVWDRISNNDFVTVANEALAARFPTDPPRFMERAPHGYWDLQLIEDQLREAGFSTLKADAVEKTSRAVSAHAAAMGYCQGNPLRAELEERAPGELDDITDTVAEALQARFGQGPIEGRLRAFVLTAA